MLNINKVYLGDCLELMRSIPDKSIDMINTDLPYQITNCSWDKIIPFKPLWKQYERIIKDNGAIVLSGIEPFSSHLRLSNLKIYKYDWVWKKSHATGYLKAWKQPMRNTENILIFYKKQCLYNPIITDKSIQNIRSKTIRSKKSEIYNDSDLSIHKLHKDKTIPKTIIEFNNAPQKKGLHPTQKPVALYEYLIKTYTNEGDLVLDSCAGSGTTAIACINTKRNYILMEQNKDYYNIILERIKNPKYTKPKEIKLGMKLIFGKKSKSVKDILT